MPGSLKGRALRDFIGVAGVKMRHVRNAGAERLPERLMLALRRLGITEEEAQITARRVPKKADPTPGDD